MADGDIRVTALPDGLTVVAYVLLALGIFLVIGFIIALIVWIVVTRCGTKPWGGKRRQHDMQKVPQYYFAGSGRQPVSLVNPAGFSRALFRPANTYGRPVDIRSSQKFKPVTVQHGDLKDHSHEKMVVTPTPASKPTTHLKDGKTLESKIFGEPPPKYETQLAYSGLLISSGENIKHSNDPTKYPDKPERLVAVTARPASVSGEVTSRPVYRSSSRWRVRPKSDSGAILKAQTLPPKRTVNQPVLRPVYLVQEPVRQPVYRVQPKTVYVVPLRREQEMTRARVEEYVRSTLERDRKGRVAHPMDDSALTLKWQADWEDRRLKYPTGMKTASSRC